MDSKSGFSDNPKVYREMVCPKCKGHNYIRSNYEDDGEIFFRCECKDCGARFVEIFSFSRIEVYSSIWDI